MNKLFIYYCNVKFIIGTKPKYIQIYIINILHCGIKYISINRNRLIEKSEFNTKVFYD